MVYSMLEYQGVAMTLVNTSRDELRPRIAEALGRFERIAHTADSAARQPGSGWTVHQLVAHVLTVAHRYRSFARSGSYRRAAYPRELDAINQAELEAVMAPVPELLAQLQAVIPEIDALFDGMDEDTVVPFHSGAVVDGITAQTNWLAELLLHGEDIAGALQVPWVLPERDMLLVARGVMQLAPTFVRTEVRPETDICLAFTLPGASPYIVHLRGTTLEIRERRDGDRPDAILRSPASALVELLYQRIGPFTAARRGLRIVGGRRPWRALQLVPCFEKP
jgi:uncharacterized protein (TIGR03083 family)